MQPALADKQWGGNLTDDDYDVLFAKLQPVAPAQNLDRHVESKSSTVLKYKFAARPQRGSCTNSNVIKDLSGNGYDAKTNCSIANGALQFTKGCSVKTPLTSKGRNYTLSFTLKQTSNTPGPLFKGPDSELRSGNGSSSAVMLVSAGNAFALMNLG